MSRRGTYDLGDFLNPSAATLRDEWRSVLARQVVPSGQRQVNFVPSEVVLSLCASLLVDHSRFGSSSAHRAGLPVPQLAALYKRPPTSILAKMANLDGTRSNGGRHELEVSARMTSDSAQLQDVYLRIIRAARAEGIDRDRLPDFLELEDGDALWLAGQEELVASEVERELEGMVEKWARERQDVPVDVTQRLLASTVRIGQHRFAKAVLKNHGDRCVFCGMGNIIAGLRRPRILTASHIKPWRDSTSKERLDPLNGLAACPTHDVAFDTGLISVADDLSITYAPDLEHVLLKDEPLRRAFGKPPLADHLILPQAANLPDAGYLEWHRNKIFVSVSR